jgi:hypothetical protein
MVGNDLVAAKARIATGKTEDAVATGVARSPIPNQRTI